MLRALLFDLDGTLLDHQAARSAGLTAHLAESMPDAEEGELVRLESEWCRLEARHYDEYTRGQCSFTEQRRRRVRGLHAAFGRQATSDATADECFASYLKHYRAAWRAFDDVLPALAAIHDRRVLTLGVITNGESEPQRAKLAAIGLASRFAMVVASGEVGVAKPAPAIFELACERMGVAPEHAAYVGDRLDIDANGAAKAGLTGIWLQRDGTPMPAIARATGVRRISSLNELPAVLDL